MKIIRIPAKNLFTILIISSLFLSNKVCSQNYEPYAYNYNSTPLNGVKIRTNIPFSSGTQMPTLRFEGYAYGANKTIGILLTWYIYADIFYSYSASSFGSYTPKIFLTKENDKVVIFIDDRGYYNRFKIAAFAQGMGEDPSWFQGWTQADETITGTKTVEVPYINVFGGNVGIGTSNPSNQLDVRINSVDNVAGSTVSSYPIASFINSTPTGGNRGLEIGAPTGNIASPVYLKVSGTSSRFALLNELNQENLSVLSNGNLGIGTNLPTERLSVNGNIRTRKLIVSQQNWADEVFHKSYKLRSLSEVEKFIKANHHLPEIPSTKEVSDKGIDVGKTQVLLLKKIEELTLYMIKQQEEQRKMSIELRKISLENNKLRQMIKNKI